MIYTPLTRKAIKLAYEAHCGQMDKSGIPYIFHPYHLAEQMTDEFTVCTALLHDVVEDTPVTLSDLEKEFPREITEAVRLLTHDDSCSYFDYIREIRKNPVARAVKLEDLKHNSDSSRLAGCNPALVKKHMHLQQKYRQALRILQDGLQDT